MLSQAELEKYLLEGKIKISYSFVKLDQNPPTNLKGEQFVDVKNPKHSATRMFKENFFGDRLRLTLGPVVMSHDRRYFKTRPLYKDRPGYFDLRAMPEQKLIIEPHEILSVNTNERIILSGGFGAYIIPRLRNVDSGLLYVPSYIDPFWDGILQAVIVNLTNQQQNLSLCEGLAICRFYPIIGTAPEELKKLFPSKSHHFGQTWKKILEEDAEPFPRRKIPVPLSGMKRYISDIREYFKEPWKIFKTMGYTGGIGLLIYGYGQLQGDIARLSKLEDSLTSANKTIEKIAVADLPGLSRNVDELGKRIAKSGTIAIDIPRGRLIGTRSFEVARPQGVTSTVWVAPMDPADPVETISSRFVNSPTDSSKIVVSIDVILKQTIQTDKIFIKWLLVQ